MSFGNTNPDGSGVFHHLLVDNLGRLRIIDEWFAFSIYDGDLALNTKTFAVPGNEEYQIQSITVTYTSTSSAGSRQLAVDIKDDLGNLMGKAVAGATQAQSLTRYYVFAPDIDALAAFRDTDYMSNRFHGWVLPSDFTITVYDNKDIDGDDDMLVGILVKRRQLS